MAALVLAIFVLLAGHADVVKAQITGSIIGNGLLGFGLAIAVGTWGKRELAFKPERVSLLSSMLVLVVIALLVPALFNYTERGVFASADVASQNEKLSLCVAIVLIVIYGANLVCTLVTTATCSRRTSRTRHARRRGRSAARSRCWSPRRSSSSRSSASHSS